MRSPSSPEPERAPFPPRAAFGGMIGGVMQRATSVLSLRFLPSTVTGARGAAVTAVRLKATESAGINSDARLR